MIREELEVLCQKETDLFGVNCYICLRNGRRKIEAFRFTGDDAPLIFKENFFPRHGNEDDEEVEKAYKIVKKALFELLDQIGEKIETVNDAETEKCFIEVPEKTFEKIRRKAVKLKSIIRNLSSLDEPIERIFGLLENTLNQEFSQLAERISEQKAEVKKNQPNRKEEFSFRYEKELDIVGYYHRLQMGRKRIEIAGEDRGEITFFGENFYPDAIDDLDTLNEVYNVVLENLSIWLNRLAKKTAEETSNSLDETWFEAPAGTFETIRKIVKKLKRAIQDINSSGADVNIICQRLRDRINTEFARHFIERKKKRIVTH